MCTIQSSLFKICNHYFWVVCHNSVPVTTALGQVLQTFTMKFFKKKIFTKKKFNHFFWTLFWEVWIISACKTNAFKPSFLIFLIQPCHQEVTFNKNLKVIPHSKSVYSTIILMHSQIPVFAILPCNQMLLEQYLIQIDY